MNKIRIPDESLTPHFDLYDFLKSQKAEDLGIDNTPPDAIVHALKLNAERMEWVRIALDNKPIIVSSGYRCPDLNAAIGSKPSSDHVKGLATDFVCPAFGTPAEICRHLQTCDLAFKQLIYERTWVHISWDIVAELSGAAPKRQVLTLLAGGGYGAGVIA